LLRSSDTAKIFPEFFQATTLTDIRIHEGSEAIRAVLPTLSWGLGAQRLCPRRGWSGDNLKPGVGTIDSDFAPAALGQY
jgi:hypothetical protein